MASRKKGAAGKKQGGGDDGGSVLNAPLDAVGGALKQGRGIAGELAERASSLGRAALESASSSLESVSPTAAELLRPGGSRGEKKSTARPPNKRKASKVGSGTSAAAEGARKATREAGRAAQKAVGSATRAVAQTAPRGGISGGGKKSGGGKSGASKSAGGKSSKGGAGKK